MPKKDKTAAKKSASKRFLYTLSSIPHYVPAAPKGFVVGGVRDIRVFQAYPRISFHLRVKSHAQLSCCSRHRQEPSVSVDVEFAANLSELNVTVSASHPCGIRKVGAYIAQRETKLMPPLNTPVESYVPKLVGDDFIDKSANVLPLGPIKKTLTLPIRRLIDEVFYVAVSAVSFCGSQGNNHAGPFLVI